MNEHEQNRTERTAPQATVSNEQSSDKQVHNEQQEKEHNQLNVCKNELKELKDRYIRTIADFENYKRRIDKEKSSWILTGQEMILSDILTIVDNFDRAFKEQQKVVPSESDAWLTGFKMIHKEFQKMLIKHDVVEITDSVFDPAVHEALMQVESADHESGTIVDVLEKGYRFKDSVLRPAKVSVAK